MWSKGCRCTPLRGLLPPLDPSMAARPSVVFTTSPAMCTKQQVPWQGHSTGVRCSIYFAPMECGYSRDSDSSKGTFAAGALKRGAHWGWQQLQRLGPEELQPGRELPHTQHHLQDLLIAAQSWQFVALVV
jgi:hypothetical protein